MRWHVEMGSRARRGKARPGGPGNKARPGEGREGREGTGEACGCGGMRGVACVHAGGAVALFGEDVAEDHGEGVPHRTAPQAPTSGQPQPTTP